MTSDGAVLERHGAVALISFNRPERLNAFGPDTGDPFLDRLAEAGSDSEVRGVVVTGKGKSFCAGANLKELDHSVPSIEDYLERPSGDRLFRDLQSFKKPIIAAVNGHCVGVGCAIALCCDFILAGEDAVFMRPETRLGILPGYAGTLRLARFVGRGNALNIVLTSRKVGAEEALRMGLASQVYPPDQLVSEAIATMTSIAAMPALAVRLTRESLQFGYESGMPANEEADLYRYIALSQTAERADRHQYFRDNKSHRS
jgi:enoyl-CoA hydratase/carnithine racemase